MRELILAMSVSVDGFVAGADGNIQWVFNGDEEAKDWKVRNAANASLHIMGSRTFRGMATYWPTATDAFAPAMNQIPKAVFSKQGPSILKAPETTGTAQSKDLAPGGESWTQAYVAGGDLAEEIGMLKAHDGKPIIAHGGATFARSLVAAGLVDQYYLMIHPVALGKGLAIFSDLPASRPLTLVSSTAFPLGSIAQIYRPA